MGLARLTRKNIKIKYKDSDLYDKISQRDVEVYMQHCITKTYCHEGQMESINTILHKISWAFGRLILVLIKRKILNAEDVIYIAGNLDKEGKFIKE